MSLEIEESEKELFKLVVYGHANSDFEPLSDYALSLFGYPIEHPFPKGKETRKKILITDLDGVWNAGDQIFVGYLKRLRERNRGIEREFDRILEIVKEIKPGYVDEPVGRISKIFRECDVRKWQDDWACEHSIDEIGLVPYGFYCLAELEGVMHYDIYCFSGSHDRSVKRFVSRRMGLPANRGYGSVYNFESEEPNAKFVSIDPLLYGYKRPVIQKILKETTGTVKSLNAVLSDEPGDIKMVSSFANPFMFAGSVEMFPEEKDSIVISLPEFRNDSRVLVARLKKIERALCFHFGYTTAEKEKIFSSALGLKKCSELIKSAENEDLIKLLKNKKLEYFSEYKSLAWKIFPLILSGIDRPAYELENAINIDEIKLTSHNFWNKYRKYSPDSDIAEIYYNFREPNRRNFS